MKLLVTRGERPIAKRIRSSRGNWLVIEIHDGVIYWCTWVRTAAGAQASKRWKERYLAKRQETENLIAAKDHRAPKNLGRVFIMDIDRALEFFVTRGGKEIREISSTVQ